MSNAPEPFALADEAAAVLAERTGVVLFPFPARGQSASFPPFTWQE